MSDKDPCSAISAGHEQTLEIAKEILKAGGNAFDAAISAYLAMFITEPCMASAGGGGFAMCHRAGEKTSMLDFFVQTPGLYELDRPIDRDAIHVDFGDTQETFYVGLATAAVPGAIAGIFSLYERFGSLPFKELVAPVLDLCRSGLSINTFQAYDLELLESILRLDPSMKDVFYNGSGLLKEGDQLHMPHLADFLQFLVDEGRRGFYEGEIAIQLDRDFRERGGFLRRSDLKDYQARWLDPMIIHRYGKNIVLPNGPSLGGAIIALLYKYRESHHGEWVSSIYDIKHKYKHPIDLSRRLEELHPELGFHVESPSVASRGTSHFNILDKQGNAIALTTTIGEGCGYFIPGTDMHMNNVLGEPFLLPYGLDSWMPNMRLNSMMTPVMITDDAGVSMITGSGGASRIPFVIAQVIAYVYEEGMDLYRATEKGRINVQDETLHVEEGNEIYESIRDMQEVHWKGLNLYFGGVHSIYRDDKGGIQAAGDSRRYGVGEVFR